jgi:hypothetical protein
VIALATAPTLPSTPAVLGRYLVVVEGMPSRFHSLAVAELAASKSAVERGAGTVMVQRKSGLQDLVYFLRDERGQVHRRDADVLFGGGR